MIRCVAILFLTLVCATQSLSAVQIQEFTTSLGIRVWLVEDHSIPLTAIEIRLGTGAGSEKAEIAGVTNLTVSLMGDGAGDLDTVEFSKKLEESGASIGFSAYSDTIIISSTFITETRDEAAGLLKMAIVQPSFDPDAFERTLKQAHAAADGKPKNPRYLASTRLDSLLFGDHYYARSILGTRETLSEITRENLLDRHRQVFVQDGITVGAAGDITRQELTELIDGLFASLPMAADRPAAHAPQVSRGTSLIRIDYPSPQSVVVFGHEAIRRDDPDFLASYVLNEIFGRSGFSSRLQHEMRTERGLTYGVGTILAANLSVGTIRGAFSTANDTVEEAIAVLNDEWRKMADTGITSDELADIKVYLTGEYPLRFDGNSAIASILSSMLYFGLPARYVTERNTLVESLTLDEMNRVARKLFRPDDLHIVVVGG